MKTPDEHARSLFQKAENDLIAANAVIATGKALDTVCFHAQQAVEKCLKAMLASRGISYPWRHDLGELVEAVKAHVPEIADFERDIFSLSPFAVQSRYDDAIDPPYDVAKRSLDIARCIFELTSGHI